MDCGNVPMSGQMPLISVVLPAYNVEPFVARALESVIAQDYPRLEIVFVDDASTDATRPVAERILRSCKRPFQVLRQEKNGGVSAARNAGLQAARGEYVCFVDPDDFVNADYLSTLYGIVSPNQADIAFCGFNHYYEDTGVLVPERFRLKKALLQASDYLFAWHMRKLTASVWCFLYRKDFLLSTELRFNERCRRGEDGEFIQKTLLRSAKTVFANIRLYNYVHHKAQITAVGIRDERAPELKRQMRLANVRAARYSLRHTGPGKLRRAVLHVQEPEIMLAPFVFLRAQKGLEKLRAPAGLPAPPQSARSHVCQRLGAAPVARALLQMRGRAALPEAVLLAESAGAAALTTASAFSTPSTGSGS